MIHLPQLNLGRGIRLIRSSQIERLEDGRLHADGDDPQLVFWLPVPRDQVTFAFQIISDVNPRPVVIYYGHSLIMRFDERQKLVLGSGCPDKRRFTCQFEAPVRWIRIDPSDAPGPFEIRLLSIQIPESRQSADYHLASPSVAARHGTDKALGEIRQQIRSGTWAPESVYLLVTHEISGTGAPLLCRKISSRLRQSGSRCIILSLSVPGPQGYADRIRFENDCDALLYYSPNDEGHDLIRKLAQMGIRRALLNTVVSGRVIQLFRQNGFRIVSLIHEMRSSCRILRAEGLVQQIAALADRIVFPARCVMDDFLSFGHPVTGRCLVRPQGYYKGTLPAAEPDIAPEARIRQAALAASLGLPSGTRFICGAGSINFGKGVDILPLVARQLISEEDAAAPYHFLWIGGSNAPEYEIWVRDQIDRMGLDGRFHFPGYFADEHAYMDCLGAASAYALVSREDSMPSVVIEAMAAGVPAIAFRKGGGAEEMLADGRGYLVDYMDIEAFSGTIAGICTGSLPAAETVRRASAYVREALSFEAYVDFLVAVFREID